LNISIVEYIYSGRGRGEVKGPTPLSRWEKYKIKMYINGLIKMFYYLY
jgi:hypothetical protein